MLRKMKKWNHTNAHLKLQKAENHFAIYLKLTHCKSNLKLKKDYERQKKIKNKKQQ